MGLILAHDWVDAAPRDAAHAGGGAGLPRLRAVRRVDLDVDLKLPGYELRVLEALREHGLLDRALISTQYEESLALLRSAEPGVRLGWSVPKLKRDPFRSRATRVPAFVALHVFRRCSRLARQRAIRDAALRCADGRTGGWSRRASCGRARGRRGDLRVDGRRAASTARARGAWRDRSDHQRPEAVCSNS